MRYLFAVLLFSVTLHATAQRYAIDSFGMQNGFRLGNPKYITDDNADVFHFISDTGSSNTFHLAYLKNDNTFHYINDSFNHATIRGDFQMIAQNSYIYYCLYDNINDYKLYRYRQNGHEEAPQIINTNYPPTFAPLQGLTLYAKTGVIYMFNDSSGFLQMLGFNTSTLHFESVTNLGPYKYVNTHLCDGGELYFNMINALDQEMLYKFYPMVTPTIKVVDTINGTNTSGRLSALSWADSIIYYAGYHSATGYELTAHNTHNHTSHIIKDLAPGSADGIYSDHNEAQFGILSINNKLTLLFNGSASPGIAGYQLYGYEPSSGTVKLLHTLTQTPISGSINAKCSNYRSMSGYLYNYNVTYFSAMQGTQRVLWKYDGVDTPTVVSFPGINYIADPGNDYAVLNIPGNLTSNKAMLAALYLSGSNDGTRKIYRLYDTMFCLAVQPVIKNHYAITTYPNPVTQDARLDITLKDAATFTVQLIDINGRIVYRQQPQVYSGSKHTLNIPMAQLQTGLYFYRVEDNSGQLMGSGKLQKL